MEQILVAMKKRDRMQEIIPILQKIAKPGMKVTFKLGVDVSWAIKGCWRRAAREYAINEDLQFILMSVGRGEAIMGFVHAGTLLLRRIKQSSFSSFLLCRPRARAHYRESTAPIT